MSKLIELAAILIAFIGCVDACCAQVEAIHPTSPDFKIHSEVFVGDTRNKPVCINKTLFNSGLVIDFLFPNSASEPSVVCIYDSRNRKFIMLDMKRQIRLNMDSLKLLRISDAMREELAKSEATRPLVFEQFDENFNPDRDIVSVANDTISYVSKCARPENDEVLVPYYEFLDKYALIAVTDPKRMPPFARLVLNQTIKKHGMVPVSIELEFNPRRSNREGFTAASSHELSMQLDASDYQQIKQAKLDWIKFREVDLAEYRGIKVAESSSESGKRR